MKACKFCGAEIENTKRKCPSCGSLELIRVCDNCGEHFDGNFCPKCGVKVGQKEKICPECQTVYFSNACPNCGYTPNRRTPVQQTVVQNHVYVSQKAQQHVPAPIVVKRKKKRWLLWLIAIFVVIGLFGGNKTKKETKGTVTTETSTVTVEKETVTENKAVSVTNTPATDENIEETDSSIDEKLNSFLDDISDALSYAVHEEDESTVEPTIDITAAMDEATFLSLLDNNVSWYLMPRDKVEKIVLQDRHLEIKLYLTRNDVTLDRFSGVTDYILSIEGGIDLWDSVTIDFGELGSITKIKDDIVKDGKGLHFAVEKKDIEK